jgi:hypothetical protein
MPLYASFNVVMMKGDGGMAGSRCKEISNPAWLLDPSNLNMVQHLGFAWSESLFALANDLLSTSCVAPKSIRNWGTIGSVGGVALALVVGTIGISTKIQGSIALLEIK